MISGLYLSAAGGLAENAKQQVNANNLANVNTPGFKRDQMIFMVRPPEIQEDDLFPDRVNEIAELQGGGIFVSETYTNFQQGSLTPTGNSLDMAIEGDAFFELDLGNNQTGYTRAGSFQVNPNGFLSDSHGNNVLSQNGGPIALNGSDDIFVSADGIISSKTNGEELGVIGIKTFKDNQRLLKIGNNIYTTDQIGRPSTTNDATVKNGYIEESTANPIKEMVTMIQGFRAYEANMQMIRIQDTNLQKTVNDVGRI